MSAGIGQFLLPATDVHDTQFDDDLYYIEVEL
jgi:hypothetical protein